jgi:HEAT repeat protein
MGTVDEIIRQLESGSPNERYRAAIALGQLGDPKAVPALLQKLDDDDEDGGVRVAAAWSIGQIGDLNAIQGLLYTYEICPLKLHRPILKAIGEILGRTAPDDDNSREIYSRGLDTLIQAVQDDWASEDTRAAAAEALGKTRDPKVIPALTEQLREDKPFEIAKAAARALRHFNDPQAVHALAQTATNKRLLREVRESAAESIGNIGNPQAVDTLIQILEDASVEYYIRDNAARALGRIGDPKAIEPLIRTLENESDSTAFSLREAIAEALGAFHDPRVTDALVNALGSDYYTAKTASESLKKLRDRRAVEPLISILDDDTKRAHEREFAAQILGVLGDPRAIPALVNALRDESKFLSSKALESLQRFILTHPDIILQIDPEDRNLLGRLTQDGQRSQLWWTICGIL